MILIKKQLDISLDVNASRIIFGPNDNHRNLLKLHYGIDIYDGPKGLVVEGESAEDIEKVSLILSTIIKLISLKYNIDERLFMQVMNLADNGELEQLFNLNSYVIGRTKNGRLISPKTIGQLTYLEALKKYDITFGIGPAGTGKTYLAVVYAVSQLKENRVRKIILTRPAVEAGESLGYLPGDLKEKVDPYLRPLYDALYDMLGQESCERMIESGIIEIAPLAYMRGRTLEDAYVILDEAQNATMMQLKMFLTRLGFNSKMVITGDITQVDLKSNLSGLQSVQGILKDIERIGFVTLTSKDVSRHPLVQAIIDAFAEKGY